jgi:hypothetical protein
VLRTLEEGIDPVRADGENLAALLDRWSESATISARTTLRTLAGREA